MNFNLEKNKYNIDKKKGILNSLESQLKLARILGDVYENRPDIMSFEGAMKGTKFEQEYEKEVILLDEKYVEETREVIDKENSNKGLNELNFLEGGFQLSEMLQAMVVDLMNKNWFKNCKSIMTSDFDDLKLGMDAILKHSTKGHLGMSIDFTVSNKDEIIQQKIQNEWDRNIIRGKIPVVKYFEDPDTKEKSNLLVPKFIIGASKGDVEELAEAYLNDDKETLENHPLKYLILLQIEEQLQTILDYYEVNSDNDHFSFSIRQYERIQKLLRVMKSEINLDDNMTVGVHEYSKGSIALDVMRQFRIGRKNI